ncbi:late secretory pathway protein avl9 [Halocaridina rubra]|uniref:Late secretory pathway protein avl9 n=1 Tax=Halocaridina rubra TaxID=373956 RepID=A0AAN9A8N4_HALRR
MRWPRSDKVDRLNVGVNGELLEEGDSYKYLVSHIARNGRVNAKVSHIVKEASVCLASTATPNPSPSEPGDDVPLSPTTGRSLSQDLMQSLPENLSVPLQSPPENFAALMASDCGLPLEIFTKGNLVHPYLSLQYLDVLSAPATRAFLVGASNALFVHKKHLYDVLVQLEDGKIEIPDPELKRQLSLSTEDLRFAENIVRQVISTYE